MERLLGTLAIVFVLIVLAAFRVSQVTPWRSVVMVALSTGSLKTCIEFIRYCERF